MELQLVLPSLEWQCLEAGQTTDPMSPLRVYSAGMWWVKHAWAHVLQLYPHASLAFLICNLALGTSATKQRKIWMIAEINLEIWKTFSQIIKCYCRIKMVVSLIKTVVSFPWIGEGISYLLLPTCCHQPTHIYHRIIAGPQTSMGSPVQGFQNVRTKSHTTGFYSPRL